VLLRHSGTIAALDASLSKLRGRDRAAPTGTQPPDTAPHRMSLMPVSLALWAGVFNLLFAFRAGFGVVLLDRFTTAGFARAVRAHDIKSTVLAPAMIAMLADDTAITELSPLRIVRSIEADPGELGEIFVRSPFRMGGYARAGEAGDERPGDERIVGGYLRTGDLGRVDTDGFLWIEGRVSDMINRGGLKVFPDEVEEVLRRHPAVRDAGVAALPEPRLGEVPHAWIVSDQPIGQAELAAWCREYLAPYKVPAGFTRTEMLPRSDIGKLLRRELSAQLLTWEDSQGDPIQDA
jgi:long-chain acyl-CoA synthetase